MVVWPAGSELLTAVNSVDGVSGEKTFYDVGNKGFCQKYIPEYRSC